MYVFPQFDHLSDEGRVERLLDVSKYWLELCDQDSTFVNVVRKLPFVRLCGGGLTTVDKCVDPSNKLCRDLLPSRCPARCMDPLLQFMRYCVGFSKGLTTSLFLECAELAAEHGDSRKGLILVNLLLDTDTCQEMIDCSLETAERNHEVKAFFARVAQIPFVPSDSLNGIPLSYTPSTSRTKLYSFNEVAMIQHYEKNATLVKDYYILYVDAQQYCELTLCATLFEHDTTYVQVEPKTDHADTISNYACINATPARHTKTTDK